MHILAQADNLVGTWSDLGATAALIGLFWIVVRSLREDCKAKEEVISKKDEHIAMLNAQYREDGLRNLEVLKDVADLVNTLATSQSGAQAEIRDGFDKLTTHIAAAVTKIETTIRSR
jgi:hypothetical protein